jgi:hypothetical protein
MGYTTEFTGSFSLDRPLAPEHAKYLALFGSTRRMKRDAAKAAGLPDPVREGAGLPVGEEGGYFVGGKGYAGQDVDASVVDGNNPPEGQPGLWCQWVPSGDGAGIEWSGVEKFYYYTEWLEYLIEHFLGRWGYVMNGEVEWQGEDSADVGKIVVTKNKVVAEAAKG